MIDDTDRRSFLKVAAATSALGAVGATEAHAQPVPGRLDLGPPEPFSFERLKETARRRIAEPFRPPSQPDPEITSQDRL